MTIDDFDFNIDCDSVISIGWACCAAEALKRNKLRLFSSPFDWQMKYSLNVFLNLLITNGKDFLKEIKRIPEYDTDTHYAVEDTKTGLVSMHDFSNNVPFKNDQKDVLKKMKRRFQRLNKILKKSDKVCLVSYREENSDNFFEFADKLNNKYKFSNLYIVNIRNSKDEKCEKYQKDNVTLYEFYFDDVHKDGGDYNTNPDYWKGNTDKWDSVLKHIHITNKINYNPKRILNLGLFRITLKRNI